MSSGKKGVKVLKIVRSDERLDCQLRKCQLSIELLNTYLRDNVTSNFLSFRVTNRILKDSVTYSTYQQLHFSQEIVPKKRHLHQVMLECNSISK